MTLLFFAALLPPLTRAQPEGDPIVQLSREGWQAARAAAPLGGSPEALARAARTLAELDKAIEASRWRLQGTYARSLVAAAMAASQDERGEMDLHLTHARELSERLETSAYPARWPLPFDRAAGELWFEVDDYEEALKAFERAIARQPDAPSWLGLARSAKQLGKRDRACEAYRQLLTFGPGDPEREEAHGYLADCP